MRKSMHFILLLLIAVLFSSPVQATLTRTTVDSSFVVYDDVNDIQWANPEMFLNMTFSQTVNMIDSMNTSVFAGSSDWQLGSYSDLSNLFDQVVSIGDARLFGNTLLPSSASSDQGINGRYDLISVANTHKGAVWSFQSSLPDASNEFLNKTLSGPNYLDEYAFENVGAWVSSASTPVPVPEPTAMLLLVAGLIGLAGLNRKFKKS